ncbi:MAG: hypothetical protein IPM66_02950 [Acidobacteriota bacterium]|nr:MAG: hypothetical protein IPM66_02950 [Acidobacteriota bacterium]
MFITFKLNNPFLRIGLLILVLVVCSALSWLIFSNFIVRVIADGRVSYSNDLLAAAALRLSDSPRLHFRLAEMEMSEAVGREELLSDALAHAKRATDLCFWDYRYNRVLGLLQEMNGDRAAAERTLRITSGLAPNHAEVNWALANVLLRRGKLIESLPAFRTATRNREDLLPMTFDLLWQASGKDPEILKRMAGGSPQIELSLVQFFLDQSLPDDALATFRRVDRNARTSSNKSSLFLRSLIETGRLETARRLWLDLVAADKAPAGLLWNGSFERDLERAFVQFEWAVNSSEFARVGLDTKYARTGSRSIKFSFTGRDTTQLKSELRQLVALEPGRRYRLECFARAYDLITPEGPRLALMNQQGVLAESLPVEICKTEWQQLTVDFTAPANAGPLYVAIVRIPKFSYDDPTRGAIWFDDFSITEVEEVSSFQFPVSSSPAGKPCRNSGMLEAEKRD